jgi:hypothetical protein
MKKFLSILIFVLITLSLTACYTDATGQENQQVTQQQQQYITGQPIPQFTWSLERHELTEIYKARNNAVSTYSVVYNQYKGVITFECPSVGYPIPGGTQLSNPEGVVTYRGNWYQMPQAEPNGTYSPATSAGTYVMCRSDDGTAYPVYIEDNVMTFPYMVTTNENGTIVKASDAEKPSINIDLKAPAGSTVP